MLCTVYAKKVRSLPSSLPHLTPGQVKHPPKLWTNSEVLEMGPKCQLFINRVVFFLAVCINL